MNSLYQQYVSEMQKIADVKYTLALLQWDQEVYMPSGSAPYRATQIATLAGILHGFSSADELGGLMKKLSDDHSLQSKESANIKESLRNYTDQKKYTTDFVIEMNKSVSAGFNAWQNAKTKNDFKLFLPHLQKLIDLKRKECDLLGYEHHPYNALLNQFEPGATTTQLDVIFEEVKEKLVPFIQLIRNKKGPDDHFLNQHFEKAKQWDFGMNILKQLNFDFTSGRQDISTHPFTTNFNAKDVRVTTRINENDFCEMLFSCIHETGHALYEQGLPAEDYGLPSGEYLSLAIHESQSRLWENNVGRSKNFWEYNFPAAQKIFPDQFKTVSMESFYNAINVVKPSFIRTSADEVTYHFHVMIRYELEKELFQGKINAAELPDAWNKKYKDYLGLEVKNDSEGVLQDVHWSHGSFGYFPTYSLGSFYAVQFYETAKKELPGLEEDIKSGNHQQLLAWLRKNIHSKGRTLNADDLCKIVTGETLKFDYFYQYIMKKYGNIYQL